MIHVWQVVEGERKGELLLLDREKGEDGNGNVDMFLVVNGSPMADGERKRKGRSSVSRKSLSLDQFVVPQTVFALTDKPVCSFQGHLHDVLDLSWSKTQVSFQSSLVPAGCSISMCQCNCKVHFVSYVGFSCVH